MIFSVEFSDSGKCVCTQIKWENIVPPERFSEEQRDHQNFAAGYSREGGVLFFIVWRTATVFSEEQSHMGQDG